jgi:hypothetical protein
MTPRSMTGPGSLLVNFAALAPPSPASPPPIGTPTMGDIIILPTDWFARQRRDQSPGEHRDAEVYQIRNYVLDEAAIFRRVVNLRAERARNCSVYTSDDDGSAA